VDCDGRSAVQWHQITTEGRIVQTGMLRGERTSYIQTTLAVNRNQDVLVGFQDTNERMFISPRLAFRRAGDPAGTLREIVRLGEGRVSRGASTSAAWSTTMTCSTCGRSRASRTNRGGGTVIVRVPFAETSK
jgi:hypothetical protein